MDSMDNFRERFEALEQRTEQLQQHVRTVERRLRWWRGMASGVLVLGLLSLPLPSGKAQGPGLEQRVAALEDKLVAVTFNSATNELVITGANLSIVNGLGDTETTNGLGNLIVGYNEPRPVGGDVRTGSHNVVVGKQHNFSGFGGLVVAEFNEISGRFSSISGGFHNTASGNSNSISGGSGNTASGSFSSISGGSGHRASGFNSWISGGTSNTASAGGSSVSGGGNNTASGPFSSVSGGNGNTASGNFSSVSGGENNTASGPFSSVSGGSNRSAPGTENWAAGGLFQAN